MRSALVVASLLFLSACGPDPLVGTFTFTLTGTETETAPRSQTTTTVGTGTMAVTTSSTVDYVITVAQTDASPCVLNLTRGDKGGVSLAAGQACTFVFATGQVTATMTTGTLTVSESGDMLTLVVTYSYAGTTVGINFAGTGTRTYTGPRR